MAIFAIIMGIILCFGLGAALGAPYLPTLSQTAEEALELANLQPGEHLLDLGSGSGSLMLAAARRGIKVTGIEINPLLVWLSRLRLWPYRKRATVILGDYWHMDWPVADCVYVFLIGRYMPRLARQISKRIITQTKVVSYTFQIPGLRAAKSTPGLYLYRIPGRHKANKTP